MRGLLLPLVLITAIVCQAGEEEKVDANAENSARKEWDYRNKYYEWDSADPSLRITDEDRLIPARFRLSWILWKIIYGLDITYLGALDEELHARVFEEAEVLVAEHNAAFARGESTYELGINKFAGMTKAEAARYRMSQEAVSARDQFYASVNETMDSVEKVNLQSRAKRSYASFDWRKQIPFTGVKDQVVCGSCYAFASIAATEAQYAIETGRAVSLSEQFVVDCSYHVTSSDMNLGCKGGHEVVVFDWLKSGLSVPTTAQYPYVSGISGRHHSCSYRSSQGIYKINSYRTGIYNNEIMLKEDLPIFGPAVTPISGENRDFQLFSGGIYNNPNCPKTIDHVVLAVGYGTEGGQNYWIIRNSWGTTWGEGGYAKIARGTNQCGFPERPSWPSLMY